MLKRSLLAVAAAALGLGVMIGVEVFLALRREYLPTEPALSIVGTYGSGRALRFVVLGDSTAAGLGTDEANAYPTILAERLAAAGYRVELTSLGVSGARARDVLQAQVPAAIEIRPDLVFIGIGANDATHVTRLASVSKDMGRSIDRLLATGADVVVAGAPDMRADAFYEPLRSLVGWRGRQVTKAITDVARDRGVPVVPLARLTVPHFEADPDGHYASDSFHPNALGYKRWADAIFPYLVEVLD